MSDYYPVERIVASRKKVLYLMDKFNASDTFYHELSTILPSTPRSYKIKKITHVPVFPDSIAAFTPLFCKPDTWSTIRETSGEITSTELRFACGAVVALQFEVEHEWSKDLCPSFGALKNLRAFVPSGAPMLATTATVTTAMRNDIIEKLDMAGCCVLTESPNKPNITYEGF
ncbi:hypothetical protein EMCRGX_G017032 [Ephydatia muelleri]